MKDEERAKRLRELNQKCMECQEKARRHFETINPIECARLCKIGREIHKLENNEWDKIDWNSSKFGKFYRN